MEELLQQFVPEPQQNPAQFVLKKKLQKLWDKYGANLLHCYDIPGLPPDNLKIESLFSNLRRHQKRSSGRKSTAVVAVAAPLHLPCGVPALAA
ncbi:MAG: hypothetical protein KME50_32700 [Nostoc desertorum CM1-VF14]|jgi:transposase InsO family protein|nr:hypothetical protein [Nostoc desertorum CM1-VF14]